MSHYLYANGKQVGVYIRETERDLTKIGSQSTTQKRVDRAEYYHRDTLGNVDMISNNKGVMETRRYTPFGESLQTNNTSLGKSYERRGFTGHEHIDSIALVHMNARLYDPLTGRFLSADSQIGGSSDNALSYNRYAYALGNPLKYTDPDGHFAVTLFIIGASLFILGATMDDTPLGKAMMVSGSILMAASIGMPVSGASLSVSAQVASYGALAFTSYSCSNAVVLKSSRNPSRAGFKRPHNF